MEGISFVSVNCFVLISGYFLINSSFKLKKLLLLILEVLFYSVTIYIIFLALGLSTFSAKEANGIFTPTLSNQYWFFTIYVGMYILSPYINLSIKAMSQKQLLSCIVVLILLFSIWHSIFPTVLGLNFGNGFGIVWFIVLYFIAAYLKLYYKPSFHALKFLLVYIFTASLTPLNHFILIYLSKTSISNFFNLTDFVNNPMAFYSYNNFFVLLTSISLFILFLNIKVKNKIVNKIVLFFSPLTFGVYLIHDNNAMRIHLWNFINAPSYLSKIWFPFLMIAIIIAIFVVCSYIEFFRLLLFKKLETSNWFNCFCNKIETLFNHFIETIK